MIVARWPAAVAAGLVVVGLAALPFLDQREPDPGDELEQFAGEEMRKRREARVRARAYADDTPPLDVAVPLPAPAGDTALDPDRPSLVVEIAEDALVVAGREVDDPELDTIFRAAYARDRDTQVILKVERSVPHARVVQLMEAAKAAGLTRLALSTTPADAPDFE